MNLLPKDTKEFSSKSYWNSFFSNRRSEPFEWYGQYTELFSHLHTYIKVTDSILVAGCGNSALSADLYKVGYKTITNVDVSEVVIKQMTAKYLKECPQMVWCKDDLTQSQFSDSCFSCVLDKGTLDAIFTDDSAEVVEKAEKYLKEVHRLLRLGGRYVCISLLQEHIIEHLLKFAATVGWMVRVCRCEEAEQTSRREGKFTLPVFVVVCTKLKPMVGTLSLVEGALESSSSKPQRTNSSDLCSRIRDLQQYSAVIHTLLTKVKSGDEARMELCSGVTGALRYVLYILDAPSNFKSKSPMGVFIVPQRRECEWLFSTPEGRLQICDSAGTKRLVVVHLVRGQEYANALQEVQSELSPRVKDLAPTDLSADFKIPFLSVGGDVGCATRVHSGHSEYSGEFIVEDVRVDGGAVLRRLVFLNNPNVVQSEVRLVKNTKKNKKGNVLYSLDHSYLSCSHHLAMVQGVALVRKEAKVLIVGLGGGPLATFIHNNLKKVSIDTVELDSEMVQVAKLHFGFKSSQRMSVTVKNGLDFCREKAVQGSKYDAILLDVDSKDVSVGMSCPPQDFLAPSFLSVLSDCLRCNGVLILNIVCRDSAIWEQSLLEIKSVFGSVICQDIPNEVNKVLYCRREADKTDKITNSEDFHRGLSRLENIIGKETLDIDDIVQKIKEL